MTVCLYGFPPLVREFKKLHPHVDIKVATGGVQRLLRRVRTRRAALALLTPPLRAPRCSAAAPRGVASPAARGSRGPHGPGAARGAAAGDAGRSSALEPRLGAG